jgi:hypothetical protein
MIIEAVLAIQMDLKEKITSEIKKSISEENQRFVKAEQEEDRRIRELFENLLRIMERESLKH